MKFMEVKPQNLSEKVRVVRADLFEEFTINQTPDGEIYRVHAHSLTHSRTWLLGESYSEEDAKSFLSDIVEELK